MLLQLPFTLETLANLYRNVKQDFEDADDDFAKVTINISQQPT